MKKNGAFTLAEVLITVAIIGVVAAIVLPMISDKIGDIVYNNQRQKAMNVLSNGMKMMIAQSGSASLRDTELKRCQGDQNCIAEEIKKSFKVITDNLSSNNVFNETYIFEKPENLNVWQDSSMNYVFATSDGMIFGIYKNQKSDNTLTIYADVNGSQLPNEGGRDFCSYTVSEAGTIAENCDTFFDPPYPCFGWNYSSCNPEECAELANQGAYVGWINGACRDRTQR